MLWLVTINTTVQFPDQEPIQVNHGSKTFRGSPTQLGTDFNDMIEAIADEMVRLRCPGKLTMQVSVCPVERDLHSVN